MEIVKKFRVRISMVRAYEFVDDWPRKPTVHEALDAFRDELLNPDASQYFHVKVSKI